MSVVADLYCDPCRGDKGLLVPAVADAPIGAGTWAYLCAPCAYRAGIRSLPRNAEPHRVQRPTGYEGKLWRDLGRAQESGWHEGLTAPVFPGDESDVARERRVRRLHVAAREEGTALGLLYRWLLGDHHG